jgi:hypothetical protein
MADGGEFFFHYIPFSGLLLCRTRYISHTHTEARVCFDSRDILRVLYELRATTPVV